MSCHGFHPLNIAKNHQIPRKIWSKLIPTRWFKPWPFYPLIGGHDSPLNRSRSLNHPKKGTNSQNPEDWHGEIAYLGYLGFAWTWCLEKVTKKYDPKWWWKMVVQSKTSPKKQIHNMDFRKILPATLVSPVRILEYHHYLVFGIGEMGSWNWIRPTSFTKFTFGSASLSKTKRVECEDW